MSQLMETVLTIATAIVGMAVVALLVSKKSNTSGVIQAAGSAFNNALGVAASPVTGADYHLDLSYPSQGFGGFQY